MSGPGIMGTGTQEDYQYSYPEKYHRTAPPNSERYQAQRYLGQKLQDEKHGRKTGKYTDLLGNESA